MGKQTDIFNCIIVTYIKYIRPNLSKYQPFKLYYSKKNKKNAEKRFNNIIKSHKYNLSCTDNDYFSKTKNKLSRNKRTSSPYSMTSYNKANVSYEPISLSKSRNVQSRVKSPFHLYLENEDSLSYTNYLKRAKEKPKEKPINLKKKRNSLEELSRNINNMKKIEKKESFTHDNNNVTTNNGNVVNILNGTNDKNVEINFNKFEIKILPDKISDKIIHPRTHSSYTRSNVDTIINKIKEESERKIKIKINPTSITRDTKPFNTINSFPIKEPSDSECSNNYNSNDFFLLGKGKQSKMLTFLDKPKDNQLYLKKENPRTRNHSIQLKMDQLFTITNEINITCPNEPIKKEPAHYIACTETNLFYSGINTDTNIVKEDDITLKDHFSVNSHFTYQKNLLKKQSSKKTSTFATEAENNYLSAGGMNETESNIILANKNKKIQKMLTDKVQRNLRITSKMKSKSMSEHKDFLEKSFDDISSIPPSPKDEAPKDNIEKSHSSIFRDGSFNHSIESNCFISDEDEKEKLKLTQNDFPQLIQKKKSNKKLMIHRSSTISKRSKDVKPSFDFLVRDEKKKLSKEITTLKLNLTISPNKKITRNKKFMRQLSRISEISNMNQRNSKNNINSTISLIKQKVIHNNNSCVFIRHKDESFESISTTKSQTKRAKSFAIESTFREFGERILTKLHKISKVIQEENGSSSLSSKIESNSSLSSFKSRGSIKRIKSDALSKNNHSRRTSSLNFFELRSNSISLAKKALQNKNEPLSENSLKFLKKLDDDISDKIFLMTDGAAEEKDSILTKVLLILDINCNKLDEKRKRSTHFATVRALNAFNIDLQTTLEYSNSIIDNNMASDELLFQQMVLNSNIRISDYSQQIIPFLVNTYFDIKLYDQIFKVGYLDGDIEEVPNVAEINTLFLHFTNKKNPILKQKTRRQSQKYNNYSKKNFIVRQYIFDGPNNVKFMNNFFRADIIYKEYTFDSKPPVFKKPRTINKKVAKKKSTTSGLNSLLTKKTSKYYSKKSTVRCSNTIHVFEQQNSIASMNSLNFMGTQKNEPRILNRDFFGRERDVEGNLNYEEINNKKISLENMLRKQRQRLFISPLKRGSSSSSHSPKKRSSIINSSRAALDKESMMYKTHEIKSEMLKGCSSIKDTLFFYIKDNNYQTFVELFCKFKLDTEEKDKEGNTFLNLAVQCDCEDIVNFLISKGANVNTQNKKLNSPLHYALSYQNFTICDMLLGVGVDETLKNTKGLTPWQCLDTKHTIV